MLPHRRARQRADLTATSSPPGLYCLGVSGSSVARWWLAARGSDFRHGLL